MRKKHTLAVIALSILVFISTACTPAQNRSYALNEFRKAGASEQTVRYFDCVGYRESRWQANATHKNSNGTYDLGLFQINSIHQSKFAQVTGHDYWKYATNPKYNVQYAIYLWRVAGTSPWRGPGC